MSKTAMTHARITPEIKQKAEHIIKGLGLSISAAHELFYRQIIAHQGIPFDLRVFKTETIKAMNDARNGIGTKYDSITDLFDEIDT
jgi:DNA-damage-inducible protein J